MGIRNLWLAYQFDEVVQLFGQRVEGELARCEDQMQRESRFNELLELKPKPVNLADLGMMAGADIQFIPKKDAS